MGQRAACTATGATAAALRASHVARDAGGRATQHTCTETSRGRAVGHVRGSVMATTTNRSNLELFYVGD